MSRRNFASGRSALAIAIATAAVLLSACGGTATKGATADENPDAKATRAVESASELKIANFEAGTNNSYVQARIAGSKKAAAEIGASLELFDAGWDSTKQFNQMQTALSSKKFNAWLVQSVNSEPLCPVVRKAIEAGIMVTIANSPMCGADTYMPGTVAFAGSQTAETYDMWIEWIAKDAKQGKALVITGTAGGANTRNMNASIKEHFADTGIEIVANQPTDYSSPEAFEVASSVLQSHPDVDIIITNWSESTLGSVEAAKQLGRLKGMRIYDLGANGWALKQVVNGTLRMTFPLVPGLEGQRSVEALGKFADTGETAGFIDLISDPSLPSDPFVTKENVAEHEPSF